MLPTWHDKVGIGLRLLAFHSHHRVGQGATLSRVCLFQDAGAHLLGVARCAVCVACSHAGLVDPLLIQKSLHTTTEFRATLLHALSLEVGVKLVGLTIQNRLHAARGELCS
ncbi:hypothetical protein [Comamonas sp.]|uniref:hypothetical protein n=1 Tax=Comamonas sp. TaxID=34028 RepID=UPI00289957CE|nr:hypothetical protein [Comamonas sp.]